MSVKIIKLQNNTEIIGTTIVVDEEHVEISDPFTINYMFSPKSERPIIGLLRYLPFADEHKIKFQKSSILNIVNARDSMSSYYKVVLTNHVNDVDKSIDDELNYVSDLETKSNTAEAEASELLAAMLENISSKNNLH